jgi:hypothetical protein
MATCSLETEEEVEKREKEMWREGCRGREEVGGRNGGGGSMCTWVESVVSYQEVFGLRREAPEQLGLDGGTDGAHTLERLEERRYGHEEVALTGEGGRGGKG